MKTCDLPPFLPAKNHLTRRKRRRGVLACGAMVFLAALVLGGTPPLTTNGYGSPGAYGSGYAGGSPRIALVRGEGFVRGSYQNDWGYAGENILLEEGDEVLTGAAGRMSVEFPGGVFMDLGPRSRAQLYRLGAGPQLRLVYGSFYFVLLGDQTAHDRVRVDLPSGTVTLTERGSYRVDLYRDGLARIVSLRGEARVQASGGGVFLADREEVFIEPGGFPTRAASYVEGNFDSFDRSIDDQYFGSSAYRLPRYATYYIPGIFDLARFGNWVYVPSLRTYGWRPRGVRHGWRPYTDGRWVFTRTGWAWMPLERWGYAPSHYGRWAFAPSLGWVWMPGNEYRSAWVRWTRVDNHIGWAVLGPGDRIVQVREGGEDHTFVFVHESDLKAGKPVKREKPPKVKTAKLVVVDNPERFVQPGPGAKHRAPQVKKGEAERADVAAAKADQEARKAQAREEVEVRKEIERSKVRTEKPLQASPAIREEKPEKLEKTATPAPSEKKERASDARGRRGENEKGTPEVEPPGAFEEPKAEPEPPRKMKRRKVEEGIPAYESPVQVEQPALPAYEKPDKAPQANGGKKGRSRVEEAPSPAPATSTDESASPTSEGGGKKGEGGDEPRHGPKKKQQLEEAVPVQP
ncbi:MAG: hypothetical protein A2Y95_07510 [Deltaproteobacteria bacterium RBG_13_65_10]|nr:MAG: hypothetical protein A2Y95_07510 [Deltaproteobacteria bacterium RBG_13_65_10]